MFDVVAVASTSVMDFRFDQLLPDNGLDYWYYQGSLTASPALQRNSQLVCAEKQSHCSWQIPEESEDDCTR